MKAILTDLKRAIFARGFAIAVLGTMLCLCIASFSEVYAILSTDPVVSVFREHNSIVHRALSANVLLLAAPILASIPYTTAFVDDIKSGYLKVYLTRTNVGSYVSGKIIACALSGGLALFLGLMLGWGVITLVVLPTEVYVDYPIASIAGEIVFRFGLYFAMGMLFAEIGMFASTAAKNAYLAYAAPFIFYYVLIILQERYFRNAFMLNPQNYLTMQGAFPLEGRSALIMLIALALLIGLAFYLYGQGQLQDDDSRRKLWSFLPKRKINLDKKQRIGKQPRVIKTLRQVVSVTNYNFRMWRGNVRVLLTFALAFILCFLLSDKAARFAYDMNTTMQAFEPFVWTFGDANSVMLISLMLILLFVDMPFLGAGVPYYLVRMKRSVWAAGQIVYIVLATLIYMLFIFAATTLICMQNSFIGNMWSETAAILGYSGAGKAVALPALVKTLELSRPYACTATIFLLMTFYTLTLVLLMLLLNIKKGKGAGIIGAFVFSLFGFLLNPELIKQLFSLPDELIYKANVAVGWLSPLNHATYHMHNFGYDLLPRLWQTYAIFGGLIVLLIVGVLLGIRKYNFNFTGTENGL
ncbi:MAG: hypothetical protein Q4C01_06945 [Clostridia bacterium]|nr:hypothetical protein [Clostridia bacterium]